MEKIFEHFKKFTAVCCIAGLLGFLVTVVLGTLTLLKTITMLPQIWDSAFDHEVAKSVIVVGIFAIDQYLIAFVFFIFSAGTYGLFLTNNHNHVFKNIPAIKINSLDQLKDALGKTVILALLIEYFKCAIEMKYRTSLDLLYLSLSILGVSMATFFLFGRKMPTVKKES